MTMLLKKITILAFAGFVIAVGASMVLYGQPLGMIVIANGIMFGIVMNQ